MNPYNGKNYSANQNLEITNSASNIVFNFAPIEISIDKQKGINIDESYKKNDSFVSDVDMNIPQTDLIKRNTFAVIIGNEDYSTYQVDLNNEVNVDFAKNDAILFQKYLTLTLGVPKQNTTLLLNGTAGQINQAIHKLVSLAQVYNGEAELIFYYAGHGLPDDKTHESYLMPVDISGYTIQYGINLNDLYEQLTKYPIKRALVFIDACFSGAARNESLTAMRGVKVVPKEYPIKQDLVVFTSSSGTQSSLGYDQMGHGFFTYFLLKHIQQSKGNISLLKLGENVSQDVRRNSVLIKNKEQTPQILINPLSKNKIENTTLIMK